MTTLEDRPNEALLVIDVQNGVVGETHQRDSVVANIATLVDRAHDDGILTVWVQHSDEEGLPEGSEPWAYVSELSRPEADPLVPKTFGDAFEDTFLEDVLADGRIGHLYVTGAQTDGCIQATIHGAFVRGYDVSLIGDAHTTEDLSEWGAPPPELVIAHTNLYWENHRAPGRDAAVVATRDVTFGKRDLT